MATEQRVAAEPPPTVMTFGRAAFAIRLEDLRAQIAALTAKAEEMEQWIALCDSAAVEVPDDTD